MADTPVTMPQDMAQNQGQGVTEVVNQLTNVARQLSVWSQSMTNIAPAATTTVSPKFTAVTLSTTASVVIGTSVVRHGLVMHNPGTTTIYVFATAIASTPGTTNLAGTIAIYPGGTLSFPASEMPNINAGFSAFNLTGASQPFTVVEFF